MSQVALVKPVKNIEDSSEERVLGILAHLEPVLEDWRAGEDFRVELSDLEGAIPSIENEIATLNKKNKSTQDELDGVLKNFKAPHMLMISGGLLLAIVSMALRFVAVTGMENVILVLGIALIGIGVKKLSSHKKALLNEQLNLNNQLTAAQAKLSDDLSRINQLRGELLSRVDTFPAVTQIRCAFPVALKKILGKKTLLDESGIYDQVSLETIDLSTIQADLDAITSKINQIQKVPVLLSPITNDVNQGAINSLYGEENTLQDLVGDFTNTLDEVRDVELRIPLIANSSPIAQDCLKVDKVSSYSDEEIKVIKNASIDSENLNEFVKQVNATKEFGNKVLGELKQTFESLESICNTYSFARSNSINDVHQNLFEVLNKASWCSKRFYCPRTIQAPKYIQDLLNIDPQNAHMLKFDGLVDSLKGDQVILQRIKEKPQLIDELYIHYSSIHDLQGDVDLDESGQLIDRGDRPAYMVDQYQEALVRFRRALSVLMTGSVNPVLTFSSQAVMYFDPEVNEWHSDIVPYVYDSPTMLKYGQVLKINTDLMMPLWEHLWTEKADFRKSELFRTNESLIRMSEKESEKLIEVGNQFRADMRSVRENINLLESDLKSKFDELVSFRDGMAALGLLSDRQKEFLTDEKLKSISLGDESVLQEGEECETLLSLEPKAQSERRGTVTDPVDFVKSPDVLISYTSVAVKRLSS